MGLLGVSGLLRGLTAEREPADLGRVGGLFLLVFDDPEDPADPAVAFGTGWTLVVCEDGARCFSVPLGADGAGARLDRRRAEETARDLLADHGLRVTGWHHGTCTHPVVSRASVDRAPRPTEGGSRVGRGRTDDGEPRSP